MKVKSVANAERKNLRRSSSSRLRLYSDRTHGGSHHRLRRRGRRPRREFQRRKLQVPPNARTHPGRLYWGLLRGGLDGKRADVGEGTRHSHIEGFQGRVRRRVWLWRRINRRNEESEGACSILWCALSSSRRHVALLNNSLFHYYYYLNRFNLIWFFISKLNHVFDFWKLIKTARFNCIVNYSLGLFDCTVLAASVIK